ncbi:MAG: NADH-quinone oxidoreductase subunit I [Candidatus Omnitrophica bacterium]|nr:NADH-quinone oxidoreductase subunit I [Candidatus Omnitrophota bacterium]
MPTKVVRRPELTFWDRLYLPQVLAGLWVTSRHFFFNLFFHILHRFGLFKWIRAAVTFQYPEEQRPLVPRSRTRHRLTKRDDGSPRCVACMMCETVCPATCITITAEEHPDPNVEKRPKSFVIDLGKCVYCGFCVEACPEDAIRMDTQILDIAAYSREAMVLDMPELLNPRSARIVSSK